MKDKPYGVVVGSLNNFQECIKPYLGFIMGYIGRYEMTLILHISK